MFELKRQKIIRFKQSPRENLSRKTDSVFFYVKVDFSYDISIRVHFAWINSREQKFMTYFQNKLSYLLQKIRELAILG